MLSVTGMCAHKPFLGAFAVLVLLVSNGCSGRCV